MSILKTASARDPNDLRADSAKSDIRRDRLASAQVIPKSECEIAWRPVAEGHDREDIRNRMDLGSKEVVSLGEVVRAGGWLGPRGRSGAPKRCPAAVPPGAE